MERVNSWISVSLSDRLTNKKLHWLVETKLARKYHLILLWTSTASEFSWKSWKANDLWLFVVSPDGGYVLSLGFHHHKMFAL